MLKYFERYALLLPLLLGACATAPLQNNNVVLPEASPIFVTKSDHPIIALALGSGGNRGFAHIGVIKALEENNIPVDIVVGCSAGSVVGALYAGGYHAEELEKLALDLDEGKLGDFEISKQGYIRGKRLQDFINNALQNRSLEQLNKPFAALTTELASGKAVAFNHGNTGMAVRASSSIPGVFEPVIINGSKYVDGGLKDPVPVNVALKMGADIVIAVDVAQQPEDNPNTSNVLEILSQSLRIMRQTISDNEIATAQIMIRPQIGVTPDINPDSKHKMIKAGEDAAIAALPAIRERLKKLSEDKANEPGHRTIVE